jgi:hypothetical protein
VAGGWSNAEIGLHISAATAKTHVSRLLMKLDARDRAQLVMITYETGLRSERPSLWSVTPWASALASLPAKARRHAIRS